MARKTLYLVRHGAYAYDETSAGEGSLTDIGREQASLTAQRLASLPMRTIRCSTLQRAAETASIIGAHFPSLAIRSARNLCECIPCVPSDEAHHFADMTPKEIEKGATQASKAFERHFTFPRRESSEVIVCHGNLIRYLVCRVLRINPEYWMRLSSHNCGISTIALFSDGFMQLVSYNDIGHLPTHLHTR